MSRSVSRHPECCAFVAGLALLSASIGPVSAGGFYSPYQSATALGTAFAGASARADDAGFFLYNPAIIAGMTTRQTFVDARIFLPDAEIDPHASANPLGIDLSADGSSGNLADPALALGSVTVLPLAPGLNLGLGSSAPFATKIGTEPDWGGRFHLQKAEMVGLNATAAISWQVTPVLAVAGGLQVQRFDADFENNALIPTANGILETRAYLKGEPDWSLGAVAGAVLTPADGTRIGIGWRSAMTHEIDGVAKTALPFTPVEHLSFKVELPQFVSLGLEQRLSPDLRLFAEGQWIEWSRFDGFDIAFRSGRPSEVRPIEWKDTWMAAIGVGVRLTATTEMTAGLAYETAAAIDASGTTLSADAEKTTLGLGLLTEIPGVGRVALSYAHVFVHEAPVFAENPASGRLEGTLAGRLDTFGTSVTVPW